MPERQAGTGIDSFKGLRIVAEENQAAFAGHGSGERMACADLRRTPGRFVGFEIIGEQHPLPVIARAALHSCCVEILSFLKFFGFLEIQIAIFGGEKIEEMRLWIEGRRVPIRGTAEAGANAGSLSSGHHVSTNGPSLLVNSLCPIQFFGEPNRGKEFAIGAI